MLKSIVIFMGMIGFLMGAELEIRTTTMGTVGEVKQIRVSYIKGTDIKHGREAWYDESGRLLHQMHYINGRKEGREMQYSQDGEVLYDANYKKQ